MTHKRTKKVQVVIMGTVSQESILDISDRAEGKAKTTERGVTPKMDQKVEEKIERYRRKTQSTRR